MPIRTPIKPVHGVEDQHVSKIYATIAALVVLVLVTSYMAVFHFDLSNQRQKQVTNWTKQMADCLNGKWRGRTEDGYEIACLRAESFNARTHRSSVK